MNGMIATVSTKGQLVIPVAMRDALGIEPGDRVALMVEDGGIFLRPVTERLVEETCGMFAQSGMADELQKERRSEKW